MKVLIVDDSDLIRCTLKSIVSSHFRGMALLFTAINGKEGLELFHQCKPDLIITDLQMPIMNGHEFTQWVRRINEDVPIILFTGSDICKDRHLFTEIIDKDFLTLQEFLKERWPQV